MKKILFLLFAAAAFAACNDDDGAPKIRYASTNDGIVNGHLQGINMFFFTAARSLRMTRATPTPTTKPCSNSPEVPRAIRNISPSTCTRPALRPVCRPSK